MILSGGACYGGGCLVSGGTWWRPPGTVTAVGGTHPTGMHSCFHFSLGGVGGRKEGTMFMQVMASTK